MGKRLLSPRRTEHPPGPYSGHAPRRATTWVGPRRPAWRTSNWRLPACSWRGHRLGGRLDPTRLPRGDPSTSETEFAQPRVIRRARAQGPEELALRGGDGHVVDARLAPTHEAVLVELP